VIIYSLEVIALNISDLLLLYFISSQFFVMIFNMQFSWISSKFVRTVFGFDQLGVIFEK